MNISHLLLSVLAAIIGLLIAVFPERSIAFVVVIMGVAALIRGVYDLVKVRSLSSDSAFRKSVVTRSVISILLGIVAILLPLALFNTVASIVRIMLNIFAIYMLVSAFFAFIMAMRMNAVGVSAPVFTVECIWSILIAVVLFILARIDFAFFVRIAGIVVLISAVCFGIYSWKNPVIVVQPESVEDATEEA